MKRIISITFILLVIGLVLFFVLGWGEKKQPSLYRMGVVDKGRVQTTVTATGTASAVTTVTVGSQVSGTLKEINVDFNSPVKKGQIIARIDPTFLQAAVTEQQASLERAEASQKQADRDLARTKDLFDKSLAAQADLDNAETAVDLAKANVRQVKAQLQRAKVNLDYSVITSPIDGVVISRSVDVGQTVAASLQSPDLFTIAQDLRKMQIETNIDEADIGGLQEGMEVTFTVDSYPDEVFHGSIRQIRYAAKTDQSVVTYPVILNVDNPDLKLRPGMTANVSIVTARRDDVLRLPAAALRFKPAENSAPSAKSSASEGTPKQQGMKREKTDEGKSSVKKNFATAYVKNANGEPELKKISIGINDGSYVEILSNELNVGDSVIVGLVGISAAGVKNMPGMGGGMRRR